MEESVDAGRLVRPHALHQRAGGRRRFAPLRLSRAWPSRSFDNLLFLGPIGAPQRSTVDRPHSARRSTRAGRGNACISCPIRTDMARCG